MRVVTDLSASPWPGERTVITIGAYDGVHRGHQAVIAEVRRIAEATGARSAVLTFDRHPASVVRPESAPQLLTDLDQKLELLAATGIDATLVVTFDEAQSLEAPMSFAQRVLVDCVAASVVVVGEDFHFGHGREGNVATLCELGAARDFEVLPLSLVARSDGPDEPISSTAIRRAMDRRGDRPAVAGLGPDAAPRRRHPTDQQRRRRVELRDGRAGQADPHV